MPVEKSAGIVIFRIEGIKPLFLLLHYEALNHRAEKNYWDLPKGHLEKGETPENAAQREAEEETGIKDLVLVDDFKKTIKYFFQFKGNNIFKFVTFYLAETETKQVKISGEHIGYRWLPYEEALKELKFKNAKDILKAANDYISEKGL